MPYKEVNRENIKIMVREFYGIILKDDMLAPFFINALGDDLSVGKWPEHFHTLDAFWILMMTGERGYGGNPFPPHAFLGSLSRENFEQWLRLFKEVVYRLYISEIADKFYKKADILAENFMLNLDVDEEEEY